MKHVWRRGDRPAQAPDADADADAEPDLQPEPEPEPEHEPGTKRTSRRKARKSGYRRIVDYPRTGRRGWRAFVPSLRLILGGAFGLLTVLAGAVAVVYCMVRTPDLDNLKLPSASVYEYSDGTVFYTAGQQNRVVVPLDQIPTTMQDAIVSVENPAFFSDSGISPRGIARAFVNDARGKPLQGGSTITQQFVKNAYLTDDQSLGRKIVEIFKAVKITRTYSKQQILDDYLNTVYFGRSSYGIDAAAETYFSVPAGQITDPARAAYLAALVNEPTVLGQTDPASQKLLKQRWNLVLDDMVKSGYLTAARRAAVTWPTALAPRSGVVRDAGGVDDSALAQIVDGYLGELHAANPAVPDASTVAAGGDVIVTTFDHAAMVDAVQAVNSGLYAELDPGQPAQASADKGVQVGLATVDARNGELLAVYPGPSEFDDATQAQIEPGSQMSAFAAAADLGPPVRPGAPQSALWSLMSRVGLTQNLVADPAELPESLAELERDPQLADGIAPQSPARLADAFAVFPDQGTYHDLAMALSVTVDGREVWSYQPRGSAVFSPAVMAKAGAGRAGGIVAEPGSGTALPVVPVPGLGAQSAAVIGTIGGDVSAWYSGYDGDIVTSVGVWDQAVNAKGQVVQQSLAGLGGLPAGRSADWPSAIWTDYMTAAVTGGQAAFTPAAGFAIGPLPVLGQLAPCVKVTVRPCGGGK